MKVISSESLLYGYSIGIFPMSENQDEKDIFFVDPDQRGIIPLNAFHVPKKLRQLIRKKIFTVTYDTVFETVLDGCSKTNPLRKETWINDKIKELYIELYKKGVCHSVEVWLEGELVGGLYGVALGGAFFGESMFSHVTNTSKIALVHLVAKLISDGFSLLDTQFVNPHLIQFGAIQITRADYQKELKIALKKPALFEKSSDNDYLMANFLQPSSQTS